MIKSGKRLRPRRVFSKEFKKERVSDYESGKLTVLEMSKLYSVGANTVYRWIYKYFSYNSKGLKVVEMEKSSTEKITGLETKVAELERLLGRKQIQLDYFEAMIELAKEEHNIDFKKKLQHATIEKMRAYKTKHTYSLNQLYRTVGISKQAVHQLQKRLEVQEANIGSLLPEVDLIREEYPGLWN